ncbi:aryl-alcohol dehydrogenase-like predicted oxidoreductase [Streptomyces sp. SAI-135]|nr:aryl-alcohol dehydrogenase-like predicted oxidoreductase [Streptomyces sp. SAI-090]MDH6574026.1 aryl-alcohol dehydrogenase-like predicted oxidoreductase [Streptomyces sp. SAI-117]MDH6581237.1 aryl-alcohol dehydrogenase-like predicted oxidoreductase [Streptomyces sp. SAI-133]MDH6613245.1 aryl-alcohol dehydrogenase-like predicted oxidoreductase [Streptomyces sp. SAI-135]
MRYQTFGRRTGLRVSELALGTAMFGTRAGVRANPEQARAVLDAYADAGGNFIDTSDAYEFGESEAVLGDLLRDRREQFVLATKYTRMPLTGVNLTGNSRRTAIRSVEASLRRLKTDYLDVLWVHLPDGVTPIDEILATFDDLTRSGKILHGGLSNFPAWRVAAAAVKSPTLLGVQEPLNLLNRGLEREMLPAAEAFGLGVCTYFPLASGRLTGKYRQGEEGRFTDMNLPLEDAGQRKTVLDTLLEISQEAGEAPGRVAMAWLLARADRASTAIVPIVGPRTPEQLQDYVKALALDLEPEHYRRLDEASAPSIEDNTSYSFGGEFDRFKLPAVPVV